MLQLTTRQVRHASLKVRCTGSLLGESDNGGASTRSVDSRLARHGGFGPRTGAGGLWCIRDAFELCRSLQHRRPHVDAPVSHPLRRLTAAAAPSVRCASAASASAVSCRVLRWAALAASTPAHVCCRHFASPHRGYCLHHDCVPGWSTPTRTHD